MWADMEISALEIGLTIGEFWELDPKMFEKYIKAFANRQDRERKDRDYLNWLQAGYIAKGFAGKFPQKHALADEIQQPTAMTDAEMERQARIITQAFQGKG